MKAEGEYSEMWKLWNSHSRTACTLRFVFIFISLENCRIQWARVELKVCLHTKTSLSRYSLIYTIMRASGSCLSSMYICFLSLMSQSWALASLRRVQLFDHNGKPPEIFCVWFWHVTNIFLLCAESCAQLAFHQQESMHLVGSVLSLEELPCGELSSERLQTDFQPTFGEPESIAAWSSYQRDQADRSQQHSHFGVWVLWIYIPIQYCSSISEG